MMTDKLVSVVVPTYKGCDVITRAVDSVLAQTYPRIEIIVVDDNAPDSPERKETEVLMQQYDSNKSVAYLKHEVNKNGAAARNTGIKFCHGEYIAFLDDDDWFLPEKIKCQVEYLQQHTEYSACYCLAQRDGKPIVTVPYTGDVSKELLMQQSHMYTPSLFFKKEVLLSINGFDETFRRHQDYELLLRFFQAGYRIGCVENVLLELGKGGGKNIPSPERMLALKDGFLSKFSYSIDLADTSEPGFKKRVIARHYGDVFLAFVKSKQYTAAFQLAKNYFFYSPSYFTFPIREKMSSYIKRRLKIFGRDF